MSAARDDYRFRPVTPDELHELDIEISVLGPMQPVNTVEEIQIGRHGLLAESDRRRGLLLPQVAVEYGRKTISAYERPTIDEVEAETLGGGGEAKKAA